MQPSRRVFGALYMLFAITMMADTAIAGEQADKAIVAIKRLIAHGEIKPGAVLTIRVKQGNMSSFLGRDYELKNDWEKQTGLMIDVNVMPQLDSLESIRRSTDIDLTIARTHEYPDLFQGGLIEDLRPMMNRFGFTLSDDPGTGYILPRIQAYFGDHLVGIPADMDVEILYLRRDLLEDSTNRNRYREKYGHELATPKTWAEYQQQVEFFHRPSEGMYGAAEPREMPTAWMYWMPRYLSGAAPNQYLFDDQMQPLVNSPAGIAATASYIATVPFSPPDILAEGNDYSYALPFFVRGNAFSTILTPAAGKISHREGSAVKGKFIAVPMPGNIIGGRLVRRTQFIYGNNLVVPRNAPSKELAVLFAMWLTDPDNSTRSVSANGIADPYRQHHLRDEGVKAMYAAQTIATLKGELPITAPSGTGLPGDSEYIAALNKNIWLAASGKLTPKNAMVNTAREWNVITERFGRAKQIGHWKAFKKDFPTVTEPAP